MHLQAPHFSTRIRLQLGFDGDVSGRPHAIIAKVSLDFPDLSFDRASCSWPWSISITTLYLGFINGKQEGWKLRSIEASIIQLWCFIFSDINKSVELHNFRVNPRWQGSWLIQTVDAEQRAQWGLVKAVEAVGLSSLNPIISVNQLQSRSFWESWKQHNMRELDWFLILWRILEQVHVTSQEKWLPGKNDFPEKNEFGVKETSWEKWSLGKSRGGREGGREGFPLIRLQAFSLSL